jgi:hypothetical protein
MTLADRLSRDPEPWKPEPGDALIGEVLDLEQRTSDFGDYPAITVLDDDGVEWTFHGYHTIAKNELAKQRPVPGDRIGIKYHGKKQGAKNTYESYRVLVEHAEPVPAPAPNWDQIGSEAREELGLLEPVGKPALPTEPEPEPEGAGEYVSDTGDVF